MDAYKKSKSELTPTTLESLIGLIEDQNPAGGFIGTFLFGFIAPATPTDNGLNVAGIIVGVVGACIAIFIWKAISGRKAA